MPPNPSDRFVQAFTGDLSVFAVAQRIISLRITPQPNAVAFEYGTTRPTITFIEIFLVEFDVTGNLVFAAHNRIALVFDFLGNSVQHAARIGGLDQKKRYAYRITARDGQVPSATAVGTFTTGEREAEVYLGTLTIRTDGDPGAKGAGELDFTVALYDERGNALHNKQGVRREDAIKEYSGSYDPGEYYLADPSVTAFVWPRAPDVITVYLAGREKDPDIMGPFFSPLSAPDVLPDAPSHHEWDDEVFAEAMETMRLSDVGYEVFSRTLDSGPWGISFSLDVRVAIRVKNPPMLKRSRGAPAALSPAGSLSRIGTSLTLQAPDGKAHLFSLGPDGVIGRRLPRPARGAPSWCGLLTDGAEWATLVMRGDDHLDVITARDGTLRHAEWILNDERLAEVRWRVIGKEFQPHLTPILSDGKFTLVGLGRNGEVRAAVLDDQTRRPPRWISLGGRFVGRVSVLTTRETIELFALTKRRGVAYAAWDPGQDSKVRWTPLGGESIVHLFAGEDGKASRLMGITEDRSVLTMSRANSRWPARWEAFGSLDDLEVVSDSVVLPKRKPSAKARGSRESRAR